MNKVTPNANLTTAHAQKHTYPDKLGEKKTEQVEYPRKRTRAMIKCTNKGISEVKHRKDR
jgi:hypothetical protein